VIALLASQKRAALALSLSALALAGCQSDSEVGVGSDPDTAVQGNATPAPSPAATNPAGKLSLEGQSLKDLAVIDSTVAVRSATGLEVGSQSDFEAGKAATVPLNESCGELTVSEQGFVIACGDKVLIIDPTEPTSPTEVDVSEDAPATAAALISSGELFVTSADTAEVGVYSEGQRVEDITAEAGSDQLIPVPNADIRDNVVRIQRSDSTIQNLDWEHDRAGGRLRAGQGVGQIAAGDNGIVLASDTVGKRLAIYTADDVIRLHQYGNTPGVPWAVAWDEGRQLAWVTTTDTNEAHAYNISTGVPLEKGSFPTVSAAEHMAVLEDGTLVVASATGDGLQFYSDPDLK